MDSATPAAGRAFCDSDLPAVMHVSLAFGYATKGHHNYMHHIQSIWQCSAMGQLQPAFTAAEVEFAGQTNRRRVVHSITVVYRLLCMFLWLFVMCIVGHDNYLVHATHSIDRAA